MATTYLAPIANFPSFLDNNGALLSGGKLHTYLAGTTQNEATFKDNAGATAHANPIVLDSRGEVVNPVWLSAGTAYKFELKDSGDVTIWVVDDISGINDPVNIASQEWTQGPAPTQTSGTTFTLIGDQTSIFTVDRRVKTTDGGGVKYSYVSATSFDVPSNKTTVTVVMDSAGTLAADLSNVDFALMSADNQSLPHPLAIGEVGEATKLLEVNSAGDGYSLVLNLFRNYISGLIISNNGGDASHDIDISVGACRDADDSVNMLSASVFVKQIDATWAVGTAAGGMNDTDQPAVDDTWYHLHALWNPTTKAIDFGYDTSVTAVNLLADTAVIAAGFTKFRRIGSVLHGSVTTSIIDPFSALEMAGGGLEVLWLDATEDYDVTSFGSSRVDHDMTVPLGIQVWANVAYDFFDPTSAGTGNILITTTDQTDVAPGVADKTLSFANTGATSTAWFVGYIRTNTAGRFHSRNGSTQADWVLRVECNGWWESRIP